MRDATLFEPVLIALLFPAQKKPEQPNWETVSE
jgi:hypothetical protein